jgi:hypothetical protein
VDTGTGKTYLTIGPLSSTKSISSCTQSEIRATSTPWTINNTGIGFSTGNVGIGTTVPGSLLTLAGSNIKASVIDNGTIGVTSSGFGVYSSQLPTAVDQRLGLLIFGSNASSTDRNTATIESYSGGVWTDGSSYPTFLRFSTTPANSISRLERLRIDSNGNIGIGNTSPSYKLDVAGAVNATSVLINGVAVGAGGTQWASGSGGVISYNGGNVGIGTTTPSTLLNSSRSTNGPETISIENTNSGTTAYSTVEARNGTSSTNGTRILATGTGFTTAGAFLPNSGAVESGSSLSGGLSILSRHASGNIRFYTGGYLDANERMRIDASGNVGIGTSTPGNYRFAIEENRPNNRTSIRIDNTCGGSVSSSIDLGASTSKSWSLINDWATNGSDDFCIYQASSNNRRIVINATGNVGIGTSSSGYTLHVNGSVAGTSAYNNLSDKRFKKDVLPITSALQKVMAMQGITFNWDKTLNPELKVDDQNHIGFLAQDLEKVIPQAVSTADDKFQTKSVAYSEVIPVLVEAVKEQQLIIQQQKEINKAQQATIHEQQTSLHNLQIQMESLKKLVEASMKD